MCKLYNLLITLIFLVPHCSQNQIETRLQICASIAGTNPSDVPMQQVSLRNYMTWRGSQLGCDWAEVFHKLSVSFVGTSFLVWCQEHTVVLPFLFVFVECGDSFVSSPFGAKEPLAQTINACMHSVWLLNFGPFCTWILNWIWSHGPPIWSEAGLTWKHIKSAGKRIIHCMLEHPRLGNLRSKQRKRKKTPPDHQSPKRVCFRVFCLFYHGVSRSKKILFFYFWASHPWWLTFPATNHTGYSIGRWFLFWSYPGALFYPRTP